jgi:hypothetical protein
MQKKKIVSESNTFFKKSEFYSSIMKVWNAFLSAGRVILSKFFCSCSSET